jgi:LIVCS family branched-chain amino acid:cation transporter
MNRKIITVLGFALFAMFFGAGNLIFPPTLGRLSGDEFPLSGLGFLLTGVGLPLLGIVAVAKAEGGIDHIARRVDHRFSKALAVIIMLAIGPLFAIPRTCATTYEIAILPNTPEIGSWLFSAAFFAVVLWFALNPLTVVDRIGKILTPILIFSLIILILKGILDPIAAPVSTAVTHPFGKGLIEGYLTMDVIGATIMGIVILTEVRSKGIFEKETQIGVIVRAGLISAGCLAVVYGGLNYLGATTSVLPETFSRTELLVFVANYLFGKGGGLLLGVVVSAACLTTAIALTVVCGEYFNKFSYGRLNYRAVCIVVAAASLVLSNAGVEMIVKLAVPILVALYPAVMAIVILCVAGKHVENRNIWRGAVAGALIVGIVDALHVTGVRPLPIEWIHENLPFGKLGLGWLVPAAVLGAIGAVFRIRRPERSFRVLAVCPSQLATRVAIFDDTTVAFETSIPNRIDRAMGLEDRRTELESLKRELSERLKENHIDLSTIDAVTARGGFLHPLPGGVYRVTRKMIDDLEQNAWRQHPSNWGAAIANEIAEANDIDAFIVDPVVVDEMEEVAHYSGLPEIKRTSIFHASNHKAVVRRVATNLWKPHDKISAIVAHIGEGTSVGAHRDGRTIDVNNALDGDGPFSAINAGSLPTVDVVKMCFEGGVGEDKILHRIRSAGGLLAYLGTTDTGEINSRIESGDEKAREVIEAMGYQVAKEIGALAAVLRGRVSAVALTGELADCKHLTRYIKSMVDFIAPVFIYPGESETEALVRGALRVLRGEEEMLEY